MIVIAIAALTQLSLPAHTAAGQDVETRNGVRLVHNKKPLWEKSPNIRLEKILTLGDIEAENEHVAFYMPMDMALDKQGNLYVLDTGNHRIQKFTSDGEYIATLGRQGQGPGEFHFPLSLDVDTQGNLVICSQYSKKIQVIDPTGEEIKSQVVTEDFSRYVRVTSDNNLLTPAPRNSFFRDDKNVKPDPLFQRMDRQGKVTESFGEPRDYKNALLSASGNNVNFCVGVDGSIYASFDNQNRIEKYSHDGRLIWRSDRKLKYNAEKPLYKGKIERFKGGGINIEGPRWNSCSEAVAADDQGRVWVITLRRQLKEEEVAGTSTRMTRTNQGASISMKPNTSGEVYETDAYNLEVYDSEGVWLYSFPLNHFGDIIRFHGDKMYILDRLRRMQVHVYRIVPALQPKPVPVS